MGEEKGVRSKKFPQEISIMGAEFRIKVLNNIPVKFFDRCLGGEVVTFSLHQLMNRCKSIGKGIGNKTLIKQRVLTIIVKVFEEIQTDIGRTDRLTQSIDPLPIMLITLSTPVKKLITR